MAQERLGNQDIRPVQFFGFRPDFNFHVRVSPNYFAERIPRFDQRIKLQPLIEFASGRNLLTHGSTRESSLLSRHRLAPETSLAASPRLPCFAARSRQSAPTFGTSHA